MTKISSYEQCPQCAEEGLDNAEDNLVTFADTGVKHCFRHGVLGKDEIMTEPQEQKSSNGLLDGCYIDIISRKIKKSVCEFYGYMVNQEKGVHIANYYDDAGQVVMQQLRTIDKQFPLLGNKSYNDSLWGLDKWTGNKNIFITITEGQIDTLSVAQVFDCKYPVVSVPNGAGGAARAIRQNMHKLKEFKYVVLAFDSDKPGKEAMDECIKEFEPGMVRIAKWRRKDANDHLINGEESEIRNIIYQAVEYRPSPVLTGDSLIEGLQGYQYVTHKWPWAVMDRKFNPIKRPSIISIVAKPKRGKTEFLAAISRWMLSNGGNVAIISLEQSPQETFLKQVSGQIGHNLLLSTENRNLTEEEKAMCVPYKDRVVIYDHINYGQTIDDLLKNIPYMVRALNCKDLILDNLTSASSSSVGDDRKNLDKAMSDLKALTIKYDFTLWNVLHLKRSDGNTMSDVEEEPNVEQIRGTQGIEAFSDCVIGLHRDIKSENLKEKNTLYVTVLTDRMSGNKTGNRVSLLYNEKTGFLGE